MQLIYYIHECSKRMNIKEVKNYLLKIIKKNGNLMQSFKHYLYIKKIIWKCQWYISNLNNLKKNDKVSRNKLYNVNKLLKIFILYSL